MLVRGKVGWHLHSREAQDCFYYSNCKRKACNCVSSIFSPLISYSEVEMVYSYPLLRTIKVYYNPKLFGSVLRDRHSTNPFHMLLSFPHVFNTQASPLYLSSLSEADDSLVQLTASMSDFLLTQRIRNSHIIQTLRLILFWALDRWWFLGIQSGHINSGNDVG